MKMTKEDMAEAMKAFSEAMEEGGPDTPRDLQDKRKALKKLLDDYLCSEEAFMFAWGYFVGKAASRHDK